ncbi:hypothetical protein JCM10914A_37440 [Paenibacillus sp. JCM 10914]|uniref:hypothetical protein n=1 Tax=Paenibacillus sp. JCM 10914 TaxID=1236974 RepID=UPI0003CCB98B|nr:hypothetical protein [Paenibacillus sp. JCM 10914]GAE04431.1 hypothetical protein JCM10914_477 [Paenibacillus sp. JCM 10914]
MSASPLQTEEELLSVKECVILPLVLDVLEQDIHRMKPSGISPDYLQHLQAVQKMTFTKLAALKRSCRARGIAILNTQRRQHSIHIRYRCRGYQHDMELMWDFVRADIQIRLAEILHISLE